MGSYYISEYLGNGSLNNPFRPFGSEQPGWSAIDLRPDKKRRNGFCLLHLPVAVSDPRLLLIGLSPLDLIGSIVVNAINAKLGTLCAPGTLSSVIAKIMTEPNGWKPLKEAIHTLTKTIYLGGLLWSSTRQPVSSQTLNGFLVCLYGCHVWLEELNRWFPIIMGNSLATDDFNRADETPLAGNWTQVTGSGTTLNLSSNVVVAAANSEAWYYWNANSFGDDQYSQMVCNGINFGDLIGPIVRFKAAEIDGYLFDPDVGTFKGLNSMADDFITLLAGWTFDSVSGSTYKLSVTGSALSGYKDGVEVTGSPTTDTEYTTGKVGIHNKFTGFSIDDWEGGDVGVASSQAPRSMHQYRLRHSNVGA